MSDHPPNTSPRPPENPPERTQTGEFRAAVEPMFAAHDRKMTLRGWAMAFVSAIAATATGVVAVLIFVDNRVQAQTDAGVRVHEQRLVTLEEQRRADRAEFYQRFERLERSSDRQEDKLDALLERLKVPNPAPKPSDGGPP